LYASPNIIRAIKLRIRWTGHVVRVGDMRNDYKILLGKPTGKRPLGRNPPVILNDGTRWRQMISSKARPLYPR